MVSIIVPVYNVELYIGRCVESILSQTRSDWELLLIDDGSTDKSGLICDAYADNDTRIKCYHKKNGGQSSARNIGLEKADGEQIVFCDSDDWLAPDFLEICVKEYAANYADIVTTNYYDYYSEKKIIPVFEENKKIEVCTNKSAMKRLLENDGTSSSVCGRLYDRKIFDNVRFQDGMLFEDAAISYKLFMAAEKVVFIPKPLMFYFHRAGSTMSRCDKKIRLDEIRAAHERYVGVRKVYDDEIAEAAISNYVYDMIHVTECYIREGYDLLELQKYDNYLRGEINKYDYHYGRLFSKRKKIEAYLWLHCPSLFKVLISRISHMQKQERQK